MTPDPVSSRLWRARATAPLWMMLLAAASSPNLLACTACFGQSDSAMARGMNMGIFSLLLVITSVLFGIAGFFVYLVRRSSQLAEARQPATPDFSEHRTNA